MTSYTFTFEMGFISISRNLCRVLKTKERLGDSWQCPGWSSQLSTYTKYFLTPGLVADRRAEKQTQSTDLAEETATLAENPEHRDCRVAG